MKKKLISSMFLFGIIATSFSNYIAIGLNAAELEERIEYVPKDTFKFWNAEPGVEYKKDEIVILGLEKKKVLQNFTANGDDNWWNAPSLFELVEISTPESDVIEIEVVLGELNPSDLENIYTSDGVSLADVENKIEIQENISSTPTLRGVSISTYFRSAYWVSNREGPTLSVDPYNSVRLSYDEWPSWNALANRNTGFGNHYAFSRNREALLQQYYCHQDYAWTKARWNLDTWRPWVSYGTLVARACNP